MSSRKEYGAYCNARRRCENQSVRNYHNYGGRGIKFLFSDFSSFLAAVGPAPSPRHTIDRYPDNNGNYEPGNVRWATPKQQRANQRAYPMPETVGEKNPRAKITEAIVRRIRLAGAIGMKRCDIASVFALAYSTINEILRLDRWKHIALDCGAASYEEMCAANSGMANRKAGKRR